MSFNLLGAINSKKALKEGIYEGKIKSIIRTMDGKQVVLTMDVMNQEVPRDIKVFLQTTSTDVNLDSFFIGAMVDICNQLGTDFVIEKFGHLADENGNINPTVEQYNFALKDSLILFYAVETEVEENIYTNYYFSKNKKVSNMLATI